MSRFRTPTAAVAGLLAAGSVLLLVLRADEPPLFPTDLPPDDKKLVEFLLLLPVAALVCSVARTVVGLHTYGTFAPALLGLSFREVDSAAGVFVLLVVLSVGWVARRGVARLNLLQVPRSAAMLTLIAGLLAAFVLFSNAQGRPVAQAVPLLPLVIVTALVERFWTTEEEDGTPAAVRTMAATFLTAGVVYLVVRAGPVARLVTEHPEGLGLLLAGQVALGRYAGYRLVELYRFRDLAGER